jgi:DNA-binding CsgD family transcriptional regulator
MTRDISQLSTLHKHNAVSHVCAVTEQDYLRIEPVIRLLERVSEIEKSTLTVFDMHRKNYLLKSSKFKEMLGYNRVEDIEEDDMALFHKIIHPDDLPFVLDTENKAHTFFNNLPASEKKNYKMVYDFRVKNTSGIYLRFIHQFAVLEQDSIGKSWLVLIITDLISERALSVPLQRRMINIKTGKLCLFNDDSNFKSDKFLTNREVEVLRLISQGLDSQSIANKLFISVNTVNNHRQKILSKTGTENTTQALLYAKKIGII